MTHCEACGCDYATVEHGKTCPHCGSGETYLLQGQEVMIKQIETPDEDPTDAAPDGYPMPSTPLTLSTSSSPYLGTFLFD